MLENNNLPYNNSSKYFTINFFNIIFIFKKRIFYFSESLSCLEVHCYGVGVVHATGTLQGVNTSASRRRYSADDSNIYTPSTRVITAATQLHTQGKAEVDSSALLHLMNWTRQVYIAGTDTYTTSTLVMWRSDTPQCD